MVYSDGGTDQRSGIFERLRNTRKLLTGLSALLQQVLQAYKALALRGRTRVQKYSQSLACEYEYETEEYKTEASVSYSCLRDVSSGNRSSGFGEQV